MKKLENDQTVKPPAPLAWALEYLPEYFTDTPAAFHHELFSDLEDSERRLLARVAPRGHAKSTCAAFAYPLWCICEQSKRNIVIITHESSLAAQFLRDIRTELESNPKIIAAYGDLCTEADPPDAPRARKTRRRTPRKWTETLLTTSTGVTVQAKGCGASIRGTKTGPNRPDLIICDDIEKDDLVRKPANRRKLEHWLRRAVMPALAPDGRLLVLGSLIHYDSLLANLSKPSRFKGWDYRVYRAKEATTDADGQHYLTALWPARWPLDKLDEERERIGTLAFEQEYQANPIDDKLRVFKPEWLRRCTPDEIAHRKLITLMAVDPATGKEDGDYFAIWVGGIDRETGVIYTLSLTIERIGIVEQVKRIIAAFERWKPMRIGIETNAYQIALKDILDDHSRKQRLYMPIVKLNAVANKIARIQGSSPFYENGTFRLPAVLDPEIESQFLHFPATDHDDGPDVCAMGIELARSLRSATEIESAAAGRNPFARKGGW